MDGEKKCVLVMIALGFICLTVLYVLLFVSLWPYKEWVGVSLLVILALVIVVWLRGRLNEQQLRQVRYRHHEELPLDVWGEPMYWPEGVQENPHHLPPVLERPACQSHLQNGYD